MYFIDTIKTRRSRVRKHSLQSAFTLIELLVVLSIISMLSSVALAGLTSARQKAKNTKYLQEVEAIKKAMALYYSTNSRYPVSSTAPDGAFLYPGSSPTAVSALTSALVPTYVPVLTDAITTTLNNETYYVYGTSIPTTAPYLCGSATAPPIKDYIIFFDMAKNGGVSNSGFTGKQLYIDGSVYGYGITAEPYYCVGE